MLTVAWFCVLLLYITGTTQDHVENENLAALTNLAELDSEDLAHARFSGRVALEQQEPDELVPLAWSGVREPVVSNASLDYLLSEVDDVEILGNDGPRQCSPLCSCEANSTFGMCTWCGWGIDPVCNQEVLEIKESITNGPKEVEIPISNVETVSVVYMSVGQESPSIPLIKKFGWYTSGVVPIEMYFRAPVQRALELTKADLRIDFGAGAGEKAWRDMFSCAGWQANRGCAGASRGIVQQAGAYTSLLNSLYKRSASLTTSLTYTPYVMQPRGCSGGQDCSNPNRGGQPGQCPGISFEGRPIECRPPGLSMPNCWKCAPADPDGSYRTYSEVIRQWAGLTLNRVGPVNMECGNEPDMVDMPCPSSQPNCARFELTFFKGSKNDYYRQFQACSNALRRGDNYATVLGPAIAGPGITPTMWKDPRLVSTRDFLTILARDDRPKLDIFSYHVVCLYCYSNVRPFPTTRRHQNWIVTRAQEIRRQMLNADPSNTKFRTVGLSANEWNPCLGCSDAGCNCGWPFVDSARSAIQWLDATNYLLQTADLESTNWVFLIELGPPVVAVLDTRNFPGAAGARYVFWAAAFYADMPIGKRIELRNLPGNVEHMASFHPRTGCGGAVLWNTGSGVSIRKFLVNDLLPNRPYGYAVYEISDQLPDRKLTGIEGLCLPETTNGCGSCPKGSGVYNGRFMQFPCTQVVRRTRSTSNGELLVSNVMVRSGSITYIKFFREDQRCTLSTPPIRVLKRERYYQLRGPPGGDPNKPEAYANFDWHDMAAYMGPGAWTLRNDLTLITGFTGHFTTANRRVRFVPNGRPSIPADGLYGIRVDYIAAEGDQDAIYSKSIFLTDRITSCSQGGASCQIPKYWGTRADVPPSGFIQVVNDFRSSSGFIVDFAAYRPPAWNGKVTMLFVARGMAPGEHLRWYMLPA